MIHMAQRDGDSVGLEEESKRLIESLQYSNKQLFDANKELKKAIRIKSELIAGMSHELRVPLNIIIGFAELMLDEVPGKINEEQRRSLNDILGSGKRLLHLIDDILKQFEIESRKTQ